MAIAAFGLGGPLGSIINGALPATASKADTKDK